MIKFKLKDLFKKVTQKKDELIGVWENDADDGSGLHAIWGYGIEFLEDGKGFDIMWGTEVEPSDFRKPICWIRTGDNSIKIKYENEENWSNIDYEISPFIGAYEVKYYKIVKRGFNNFWSSPEPLYKLKNK